MADAASEVSTNGLVDTKASRSLAKRRTWSDALKRQIVAESEEPGSSVSVVARRHDVNANQVFKWRRELLPSERRAEDSGLVPVEIVPEPPPRPRRRRVERAGLIEIEFGGVRVLIRGEVSPRTLRQVIELLR
jgi:transposase